MQTVDVRVLLPDDVDPGYFLEQLVLNTRGPGAPLGAVQLALEGSYHEDNVELVVTGRVVVELDAAAWNGEELSQTTS